MSEEKSGSFGKRKIWIGGGIAAAAVILAVSSGVDFPPGSKDTVGTIVPAVRYRAEQPTAADVKLGDTTVGAGQTAPASAGNAADAARGELAKGELAKGELAKGELAKGELAKGELAKGELK